MNPGGSPRATTQSAGSESASALRLRPDQCLTDDDLRAVMGQGRTSVKAVPKVECLRDAPAEGLVVRTRQHPVARKPVRRLTFAARSRHDPLPVFPMPRDALRSHQSCRLEMPAIGPPAGHSFTSCGQALSLPHRPHDILEMVPPLVNRLTADPEGVDVDAGVDPAAAPLISTQVRE